MKTTTKLRSWVFVPLTLLAALSLATCGGGSDSGGVTLFTVSGILNASNDNSGQAQSIANPVILGGYVNAPGQGPAGRSQTDGDTRDYFQGDLIKDQVISLFIAEDGINDDLDLSLINSTTQQVLTSMGSSQFESITVPEDGRYQILVNVCRGASGYVLSIGQTLSFAGADMNNNGILCEPGEACGAYLTQEQPIMVIIDKDTSDLNFDTLYNAFIN